MVTGRLRPGVTLREAQAEGARIGERLAEEHPNINAGWVVQVRTTDDSIMGDQAATIMTVLMLTVGLVLLIACANVANLLLARASARMRELAVRSALGAARGRLIGQLLTENVLIALVAGGVGIGLAHVLLRGLVLVTRGREVLFTLAVIDACVSLFVLRDGMLAGIPLPPFSSITHPKQRLWIAELGKEKTESIGRFDWDRSADRLVAILEKSLRPREAAHV